MGAANIPPICLSLSGSGVVCEPHQRAGEEHVPAAIFPLQFRGVSWKGGCQKRGEGEERRWDGERRSEDHDLTKGLFPNHHSLTSCFSLLPFLRMMHVMNHKYIHLQVS